MPDISRNRLTQLVKRFLDIARVLAVLGLVLWPIVAVGIGFDLFFEPENRKVDMFLGFKIDHDAIQTPTASAGPALIHGHAELQINTPSLRAWYLSLTITEFLGLIALYGLIQLRAVFGSLAEGVSFSNENASRIKKFGLAFVCWHLVAPILHYFGGRFALRDIDLDVPGILLYPAFELNIGGIVAGLAVIVLAGVLLEATSIHKDQSLTI